MTGHLPLVVSSKNSNSPAACFIVSSSLKSCLCSGWMGRLRALRSRCCDLPPDGIAWCVMCFVPGSIFLVLHFCWVVLSVGELIISGVQITFDEMHSFYGRDVPRA